MLFSNPLISDVEETATGGDTDIYYCRGGQVKLFRAVVSAHRSQACLFSTQTTTKMASVRRVKAEKGRCKSHWLSSPALGGISRTAKKTPDSEVVPCKEIVPRGN